MKKLLLLLIIPLTFSCCNNDDDNNTEVLPPATQTGAGTFACKVNGQNFIDTSGGYFNCFYQFIDGEYFFHITARDVVSGIDEITLYSDKVQIEEGETYQLGNYEEFSITGIVFFENSTQNMNTTSEVPGTLTITKLDTDDFIVSGTFEFDIIHPDTGEIIQIREGRFDTLFTQ